jgi:hypothetical protein
VGAMMKFAYRFILVLACLVLANNISNAQNRVAFLVGNSDYQHATPLRNPTRDVSLIGETLKKLDFKVAMHKDLTRSQIGKELGSFLKENKGADVTLFYFAGHGMQYENQNFLLGVDAKLESEFDIETEALDLQRVLRQLKKSSKASLVFVDACRDNPLADEFYRSNFSETRALRTRGLAPLKSAYNGAMITFSAAPGQVAFDGDDNSPFAASLARHLPSENVEVLSLMKRVIRDVKSESGNKQVPMVSNDLTTEIYLKLGSDGAGSSIAYQQEETMFNAAIAIQNTRAWDLYFDKFPNGFFRDLALIEQERLQLASVAKETGIDIESAKPEQIVALKRTVDEKSEIKLGLTKDDAKLIQEALNTRGYNAGVVDGAIGRGTRKAIADFQAAVNLPSTGVVTPATAQALQVELSNAESSNIAIVSSTNARKYDPKQIELIEDDPRLIKAAKALRPYEYVYGYHEGHLYIAVQIWRLMQLDEAKRIAENAGGYLASLNSRTENQFVYDLIRHDQRFWKISSNGHGIYGPSFGLFQPNGSVEPKGGWQWTSGEELKYQNWVKGEPSNSNNNEYLVSFNNDTYPGSHGGKFLPAPTWGDLPHTERSLIIEID